MIIELGALGLGKYYFSSYQWRKIWFLICIFVIILLFILSLITFILGAAQEDDENNRNIILGIMLFVHAIAVPGLIIFFAIYIPFKYSIKPSEDLQFKRKLILIICAIVFLIVLASVIMSVWGLYASGSGALVLAVFLLIYIFMDTKVGKSIFDKPWK